MTSPSFTPMRKRETTCLTCWLRFSRWITSPAELVHSLMWGWTTFVRRAIYQHNFDTMNSKQCFDHVQACSTLLMDLIFICNSIQVHVNHHDMRHVDILTRLLMVARTVNKMEVAFLAITLLPVLYFHILLVLPCDLLSFDLFSAADAEQQHRDHRWSDWDGWNVNIEKHFTLRAVSYRFNIFLSSRIPCLQMCRCLHLRFYFRLHCWCCTVGVLLFYHWRSSVSRQPINRNGVGMKVGPQFSIAVYSNLLFKLWPTPWLKHNLYGSNDYIVC